MRLFRGLSGRLLVVTVVAVMAVEVVIFIPSVARFRADYLQERIDRAHLAVLVVMAAPDGMVTRSLQHDLLTGAGVRNVVLRRGASRALMLTGPPVTEVAASFDLREAGSLALIRDALARLAAPPGHEVIRVIGQPESRQSGAIEITLDAAPLRTAMVDYGLRILQLSLIISGLAAAAVFLLIRRVVVAPLLRVVENVRRFKEAPEDPGRIIRPSGHGGEVAEAEGAIAEMQEDVRRAFAERARLAGLGEAVAKISHDLRNMLAAQHLMLDRLEGSSDPTVARVMPKMIASLDRAIRLCQRTLDYGRAEEAAPDLREVALAPLVSEVAETVGVGRAGVALEADMPDGLTVPADPEQLFRVLANLMRNAREAIEASAGRGSIRVSAARENAEAAIRVADTGPGLPARARAHLFKPFQGSARRGGTGLGLTIAHDLVRAHGGTLTLVSSTTEGTVFEIRLPAEARDSRARGAAKIPT